MQQSYLGNWKCLLYRVIKNYLCTWRFYWNYQVQSDFLITLCNILIHHNFTSHWISSFKSYSSRFAFRNFWSFLEVTLSSSASSFWGYSECFDVPCIGYRTVAETKLRIHNITAKAALKFGSEAWVLKKREEQRLEAAQMKFLRHLLGITKLDKEKNQCIRGKTGAENIVKEIKQYQEKWL